MFRCQGISVLTTYEPFSSTSSVAIVVPPGATLPFATPGPYKKIKTKALLAADLKVVLSRADRPHIPLTPILTTRGVSNTIATRTKRRKTSAVNN